MQLTVSIIQLLQLLE